jgi:propionyl-CoA synthetase
VLKAGVAATPDEVEAKLVAMVRAEIGAFAYFRRAVVVQRLPKTRSGKVLRSTIRRIAAGEEYAVPSTIEDPAALGEIETALSGVGR